MSYINSVVLDDGLVILGSAIQLHICSAEPSNYASTLLLSLGNAIPVVSAPQASVPNGRQVTISAIPDLQGTGDGTAIAWALVDGSRLLAAYLLTDSIVIINEGVYSLSSFIIRIPNPI